MLYFLLHIGLVFLFRSCIKIISYKYLLGNTAENKHVTQEYEKQYLLYML